MNSVEFDIPFSENSRSYTTIYASKIKQRRNIGGSNKKPASKPPSKNPSPKPPSKKPKPPSKRTRFGLYKIGPLKGKLKKGFRFHNGKVVKAQPKKLHKRNSIGIPPKRKFADFMFPGIVGAFNHY